MSSAIAAIRPERRAELEREVRELIKNPPIQVTAFNLLVWVPPVDTVSAGGVVTMTDQEQQREQKGAGRGFLIGIGPTAWHAFDEGKPWAALGDLVLFQRYEGMTPPVDGLDGGLFRVMRDEAVVGVLA